VFSVPVQWSRSLQKLLEELSAILRVHVKSQKYSKNQLNRNSDFGIYQVHFVAVEFASSQVVKVAMVVYFILFYMHLIHVYM